MLGALPCRVSDVVSGATTSHYGTDIRDRTFWFACRVVALCERMYERGGIARILVAQLVACSTLTAAMLEEARAAESPRDFISKCSIALKEARECPVRLRITEQVRGVDAKEVQLLVAEATEITAVLGAIVRNARRKQGIVLHPIKRPPHT